MTTIELGRHDGVALLGDITIPDGPGPFPALGGDCPTFAGGYPDDKPAKLSTKVKCAVGLYGIYDMVGIRNSGQIGRPRNQSSAPLLGAALFAPRLLRFLEDML